MATLINTGVLTQFEPKDDTPVVVDLSDGIRVVLIVRPMPDGSMAWIDGDIHPEIYWKFALKPGQNIVVRSAEIGSQMSFEVYDHNGPTGVRFQTAKIMTNWSVLRRKKIKGRRLRPRNLHRLLPTRART